MWLLLNLSKQLSLWIDSPMPDHEKMSTKGKKKKKGTPDKSFHIDLKHQIIFSFSIALKEYYYYYYYY